MTFDTIFDLSNDRFSNTRDDTDGMGTAPIPSRNEGVSTCRLVATKLLHLREGSAWCGQNRVSVCLSQRVDIIQTFFSFGNC